MCLTMWCKYNSFWIIVRKMLFVGVWSREGGFGAYVVGYIFKLIKTCEPSPPPKKYIILNYVLRKNYPTNNALRKMNASPKLVTSVSLETTLGFFYSTRVSVRRKHWRICAQNAVNLLFLLIIVKIVCLFVYFNMSSIWAIPIHILNCGIFVEFLFNSSEFFVWQLTENYLLAGFY